MSALNRRSFLGMSALSGLAAMGGTTLALSGSRAYGAASSRTNYRAIIIGSALADRSPPAGWDRPASTRSSWSGAKNG